MRDAMSNIYRITHHAPRTWVWEKKRRFISVDVLVWCKESGFLCSKVCSYL